MIFFFFAPNKMKINQNFQRQRGKKEIKLINQN